MKERSLQRRNKVYIVGIGYKPLDMRAREVLMHADVIYTSRRLHDVFMRYPEYASVREKIVEINNIEETIDAIRSDIENPGHREVVLLSSGDPLFFGIGRRMLEHFGGDEVEIMPDMSSMQMAFARIKLSWDDAFLMSLHGGPDPAKRRRLPYDICDILHLLRLHRKLAILTDRVNSPSAIAKVLAAQQGRSRIVMHVAERLGYPDERVWTGDVSEAVDEEFRDPNVVILVRPEEYRAAPEIAFGLAEDEIEHDKGMITKDEVRAVSLHKLRLPERGVLWDIGAGSGAVSLEAARVCPGLKVFAIESDEERIGIIKRNIRRFSADNIDVVAGTAPDVLGGLPRPDRVFIGGSGGMLEEIIGYVAGKTGARIVVMNAVSVQTLHRGITLLPAAGFDVDVSSVNIYRSRAVSDGMQMSPLNPVFVIRGMRG